MKIKNMKKNRRKHFFLLIGLSSMVVFGSIFIYNLVSVFIVDKITKEHFLEQCTSEKEQEALLWLLDNMKDQYSYNDSISQCPMTVTRGSLHTFNQAFVHESIERMPLKEYSCIEAIIQESP